MSFKVGDWVVRKAEWPCFLGDMPLQVSEMSITGHLLGFAQETNDVPGWDADKFELVVNTPHSDADLAMALQLADLLGQDYAQATFNSHDLCVMAREDWRVPEAEWLRDQVERELLNRGAR